MYAKKEIVLTKSKICKKNFNSEAQWFQIIYYNVRHFKTIQLS